MKKAGEVLLRIGGSIICVLGVGCAIFILVHIFSALIANVDGYNWMELSMFWALTIGSLLCLVGVIMRDFWWGK